MVRCPKPVALESGIARPYYKANDKISTNTLKQNWEKVDISKETTKNLHHKQLKQRGEKKISFRCQVSEFTCFSAKIMLTIYFISNLPDCLTKWFRVS